jgi:hypothetical protein
MSCCAPRAALVLGSLADVKIVKFDTEQLPPILNALETDNHGNRLVLEVAVSCRLCRQKLSLTVAATFG